MLTYTYDLNEHGSLILRATELEREALKERVERYQVLYPWSKEGATAQVETDIMQELYGLAPIDPEEIAALTSAPILGIRRDGDVVAAWGYMDYAVRSFVDDLIETGKAVFTC